MPEVDILMAVKNGERFIAEQIDSILAQTFQDFRLIIRDNGSSDSTPAIIAEYVQKYPDKIQAVHDDIDCTDSYVKNFMQLMTYVKADYVMFSDSDDVWLPYKVQVSLWHIKDAERRNPGKPIYIFSGLNVVDEKLRSMDKILAVSPTRAEYQSLTNLMLSNIMSGCTVIINKALCEKSKGFIEGMPFSHDSFLAALAAACGTVEHIPAAMILYRQHKHNAAGYLGIGGGHGSIGGWLTKIWKLKNSRGSKRKCEFMLDRYADVMSPEKLEELKNFLALLNRNKLVKIFMMLFGKAYHLDGNLYCRIKYFLRFVLS